MTINELVLETIRASDDAIRGFKAAGYSVDSTRQKRDQILQSLEKMRKSPSQYDSKAYDAIKNVTPGDITRGIIKDKSDALEHFSNIAQKERSKRDLNNPMLSAYMAHGMNIRDRSQTRPASMTVDPPSAASNTIRKQMESRGSLRNKLVSSKNPFLRALGK